MSRVASARPPDPRSDDDGVSLWIRRRRRSLDPAAWRSQRGSRGILKPALISLLVLWFAPVGFAEQQASGSADPPFVGLVTADRVNLRARHSLSSEVIFQFSKGSKILVVAKEGSWYGVELPSEVSVYVARPFLSIEDGKGRVKGNRVRVRAGAGQAFTSMALLKDQEEVVIRQVVGEWVKIQPPGSCRGWVSQAYLTFLERKSPDGDDRTVSTAPAEGSQSSGSQGAPER